MKYIKILLILSLLFISGCSKRSENVLSYKNDKCVVYYPDNNEVIKEYAYSLCSDGEKNTYDFKVEEKGEFLIVKYENKSFYVNDDYSDIELEVINNKQDLLDHLRYMMKVDDLDIAYTSDYMLDTNIDSFNFDEINISINDDELIFNISKYNYDLHMDLRYCQKIVGRDFGVKDEEYIKQRYINPNRKMVCLTYDDGPYNYVENKILDVMEKYDARCTFYHVGNRYNEDNLSSVSRGIELGIEYGSHTEDHSNLNKLSNSEAINIIKEPVNYIKDKLGYEMKTYRPPYGSVNEDILDDIDMVAILWNVDSRDWANRDEYITYDNVMEYVSNNDVVLMHSLYESSASATERLVPDLIDEGYQLITVSELLDILNIGDKYFYGK